MKKEQHLYDKFVDVLIDRLDDETIEAKDLAIVLQFLKNQNIQASEKHNGLNALQDKLDELPFDDDEFPIRRVK